jgi:hypothetical protein
MAAEAASAAAAAAADVGVVGGLGVVGLSLPLLLPGSADFFPDGAGVEEADDRPDLGLTGSFLALRSPFSLGGVLLRPLVKACTLFAIRSAALISGPATSIFSSFFIFLASGLLPRLVGELGRRPLVPLLTSEGRSTCDGADAAAASDLGLLS